MSRAIRIVAPFRPFPLEADHHREQADFDWMDAIHMMSTSAARACRCPVHVLTDVDTDLPFDCLKYETIERRLMLWNLEICAQYLASDDFDRDTIMLDSDQIVLHDLAPRFPEGVDAGILIRPAAKHITGQPILNGVQFWAMRGRERLVAFFRQALVIAKALPEKQIQWGADTDALRVLLEPLSLGIHQRAGLTVALLESRTVIETFSSVHEKWLAAGTPFAVPTKPVLDFRNLRKPFMRPVYDAIFQDAAVTA